MNDPIDQLPEYVMSSGIKPCGLIQKYIKKIKRHRRNSPFFHDWIKFDQLLKSLTKPGFSDKTYDDVVKHIGEHWETKKKMNYSSLLSHKPPTRWTIEKWLFEVFHPNTAEITQYSKENLSNYHMTSMSF